MNLIALETLTIKKRMVSYAMLRKVVPGSIIGILVGCSFSILDKFGVAAFLASAYTALVLPRPYLALLIFIGSIPFSAFELVGFISPALALGFVALIVAFFYFLVKGLKMYFDPLHILVAGIVFLASISVLYGSSYTDDQRYLGHALTELRRYWFAAIFYLLTFSLVWNIRQIKQIMWVIVITGSLLAIINVLQSQFQFSIPGVERGDLRGGDFLLDVIGGVPRSQGTTAHPVESGLILQVAFFISFFLLLAEKSPVRRSVLILTTFFIIPLGWAYTFARVSIIAILATIPYVMVKLRDKLNLRSISMAFGAIFLALVISPFVLEIWWDSPFMNRFRTIFHFSEDVAYRWRMDLVDASVKMFQDHPVFGFGVGNYQFTYMQYLRPDHVTEWGFHPCPSPENTYLTFVTEMGAVGLSFFLLLLVFALRNLSRVSKWYSQMGDSSAATMILGLEVALWSLIMAHAGGSLEFLKYFWLLIGLSAATKKLRLYAETGELMGKSDITRLFENNK